MLGRSIRQSLGRFIAIILIIMLGVLVFVGVKGIGPAYTDSATTMVDQQRLADVTLTSTAGLTKADLRAARQVKGAQVMAAKSVFALASTDDSVVAVSGYTNNRQLNQIIVKSGRLPRRVNEIVLDARARDYGRYRIGSTYRFAKTSQLKRRTYRVVGFVESPQYLDSTYNRGNANIGNGQVAYFAYVTASNVDVDVYTSIGFYFAGLTHGNSFSDAYQNRVDDKVVAIKRALRGRATARRQELIRTASQKVDGQLSEARATLQQLDQASAAGATSADVTQQRTKLTAAITQLEDAQRTIKAKVAKPTLSYGTRHDLSGFADYGESAERIAAIGNVFPVFFFLIAALITFTTISRMVAEDRSQLGTMKALGYGSVAISRNYYIYALLAAIIGTTLGAAIGSELLPRLVVQMSGSNTSIVRTAVINLQWSNIALALIFALIATVGAVVVAVTTELRAKPAELMQPKAPKAGKRILLERITPLWRRLSFNRKVSYRNLFRFKSRMVMTIIGIAGGAGLIVTGFGIRDSISGAGTRQFNDIIRYSAVATLSDKGTPAQARKVLRQNQHYQRSATVTANTVKVQAHGHSVGSVSFFVPTATNNLTGYVNVETTKGQSIRLPQRGVVLTQKAATTLDATVGSRVTIKLTNGRSAKVRVRAIAQNYTGQFAYMTKSGYRAAFGRSAQTNALLVKTTAQTAQQRRHLAEQLLRNGGVINTSYADDQRATLEQMSSSMDTFIVIIIVLSGLLSFVVLYNLTNINVSERMRELSTIKVLGFYDGEVTMYIVRENIILTVVGILAGFLLGNGLTAFILRQAASAQIVFPLIIHWPGYLLAAVLTAGFTAIVMWVTHRRLQRVDMVEALAARTD